MFHDTHAIGDIHIPHNWEYANAAAREAATGFVDADLKKLALQLDDSSLWILTAVDPTWVRVGAADGLTLVAAPVAYNSPGAAGQIAVDGFYLYIFRASDSRWPRVALESDW